MKRLLAITDPGCAASTRYRVAQFEKYFSGRDVQLQIFPCAREKQSIDQLIGLLKQADVVVIQRILPRTALLKKIRRHSARLVFDFDDVVFRNDSNGGRPHLKLGRWWRFRQLLRGCDAVTAGNGHLAALAARHAEARRVFTVPTVVDADRYEDEPSPPKQSSALGWIGSRWTLPYLETLRWPLEMLAADHPELFVRVISNWKPDLGNVPVELSPWSEAGEVRDLKSLRVGLAPLPDDAWTRGKCGLRLLQYLAAGVPALAAPVGTQAEIIRHGAALAAVTEDDWRRNLKKILSEKNLSVELAAAGKKLVREQFSLATWSPRVFEAWIAPG